MWITHVSIRNPVFATMVMVGIAVLGHLFVLAAASRADARRDPAVRVRGDRVSRRLARGGRDRRHQADRVRDQHRCRRENDPLDLARRPEPDLRRVPSCHRHDARDAGRARQDRAGEAVFSARREGPAGAARRPGEPAAGGVAGGAVVDDGTARAHLAHRSGHRQGPRKCAGRGQHRHQRPAVAADPGADQAERAHRVRHRRRPGGRRDPQCQSGRARRTDHARRAGFDRACRRQDQGARAIRSHHRRAAGRRAGLPLAGRRRHRRREGGGTSHRAHQRPPLDHARRAEDAGRQHHRDR